MGLFKKGTALTAKYDIDKKVLGSGNFAQVKKCTEKSTKVEYAVKIIDKAKVEDMGDIQREIEIMQMIDHKNVIKLFEIYDEPKKASAARHATRRAAPAPPPPLPPPPAPPPLSARPLAL